MKLSTYNVRALLRPGRLHQFTPGCKALNLDVVPIQEHRWRTNDETTTLETDGYNFVCSTAIERSQEGTGLLEIARHILYIKSISNRLLLVTINCNPKITIICAYATTEEASASEKATLLQRSHQLSS